MPPRRPVQVRSAALEGYSALVTALGGQPDIMLRAAHIDPQALGDPDRLISYVAFIDLLERTATETRCREFGLRLSQRQGLPTLGPVGLLARQEPDVRRAVAAVIRYLHLHAEGLVVSLEETAERARLVLDFAIPGLRSTRQVVELSVGMAVNMQRALCGARWNPDGVYFSHEGPADTSVHQRLLRAPVRFDWEFSGIEFPAEMLDLAVRDADDDLHRYLLRYIEAIDGTHGDDLVSKTRRLIQDLISSGRCTAPLVARYLAMDVRTLQRQLQARHATFAALTEEVRAMLAARHLRDSRKSLTETAELLGYSQLSAFSRSFRRWFGQPPSLWRASRRSLHRRN